MNLDLPNFDNSKVYALSGRTLNKFVRQIRRIIPLAGDGLQSNETPDGVQLSIARAYDDREGVTGFCIWDYEDSVTATTFWQEFRDGILVNASSEPAPFDPASPGDTVLFRFPIVVP